MAYITFEEFKEMLKKSIDETTNLNEALEKTVQLIYLKGHKDGKSDTIDKIMAEILKFLKCPEYENCDWRNCSDCNNSRCINFNNVNGLVSIIEADKESEG